MTAITTIVSDNEIAADQKYSISVTKANDRIRGYKGSTCLVDSVDGLIVHETHHVPVYYIPPVDVRLEYFSRTDFRTFCPFKGNASHWALELDGERIDPAAWSYEQTLSEGEPVQNHIGFYGDAIDKWIVGDVEEKFLPPEMMLADPKNLVDWLIRGAWSAMDHEELTQQLGRRLVKTGIPVMRLNVALRQLHPLLAGRAYIWNRDGDIVEELQVKHSSISNDAYTKSPLKLVSEGLGGIREKLNTGKEDFEFPIMKELQSQGATDYVALPLPFSDGIIHNLTLTSDHPSGFSTSDLGQIFEALPLISRMYEVHKVKSDSRTLLETYLGKSAGSQVLNGLVKRGDGQTIKAAILYCDLSDSTALTEKLDRGAYLDLLNQFFDASAAAVHENGGEVLKFIGDAILAIFPTESDNIEETKRSCLNAFQAARDALGSLVEKQSILPLQCTIGLHFGEVMYGNVGSEERLDFTVIGSAANQAARIGEKCKEVGTSVLMSDEVAKFVPTLTRRVGEYTLKGVKDSMELFCLEPA
jgi:adenylate cyclase